MKPSGPGCTLVERAPAAGGSAAPSCRACRRALRARRPAPRACVRAQHAFEAAPAVVDRLAEAHRDRAERQRLAVDLDRLADVRVVEELVGDAADRRRRARRRSPAAHSGVYGAMCATSLRERRSRLRARRRPARRRRGRSRPRRRRSGLRAPRRCPGVSYGTAAPRVASQTSGLRRRRGRAGSSRAGRPDRARTCAARGTARSSRSRGISCSSTWISA